MINTMKQIWADEDGQGMVEYGLIVGIISVAVIVSLTKVREGLVKLFSSIVSGLGTAEGNTGAAG
jgi:pilus assembly protein Flp/PilA